MRKGTGAPFPHPPCLSAMSVIRVPCAGRGILAYLPLLMRLSPCVLQDRHESSP